ncbi:uncharacterized protein Pyn_00244 [Prunus yedoensis var. nudiflora]|uniref:Uncharacterized protein n=1 Tax=Prunus yedoensis var. nudiflora TaxID=2094558 RepID=A0A314Z0F5_PRUYE|nr:uncharacterized protein Pyn_00244 [Prunus yedoensis var. nudiflora]
MTFLTLTPWSRRNAYDEDGRVWYEECISARFIRPVEEAMRGALKNANWDPLTPKGSKVKKTGAPAPRAAPVVGARKTLAHRTVPTSLPARPTAVAAPSRKRSQEAPSIEAATVEAAPAQSAVAETATPRRPRKRTLFTFSEGRGEEEVPPVIVSEAPLRPTWQ